MRLYHYTCLDCARRIGRYGMLRTWSHLRADEQMAGFPVVWLTDMEIPDRLALGLRVINHRDGTTCDRLAVRYIVETDEAVPWLEWARGRVPEDVRRIMEEGRAPERWFVTLTAQLAVMDRAYRPPVPVAQ